MKIMVSISKKTLVLIEGCCILGIIVLMTIAMLELYKTKDYKRVQGVIISINKEMQYDTSGIDNQMSTSIVKYVACKYLIDGKTYTNRQRTFLKFGKHVNSSSIIYYDKYKPEQVRNQFLLECCAFGSCFLLIVLIIILLAIKQGVFMND